MDASLLTQTDETKEPKACLTLSGSQLGMLKIENPQLGQHVLMEVDAVITHISSFEDEDGRRRVSMSFELDRVMREEPAPDPMQQIKSLYPAMSGGA